jgi:23S rRNA pseudouridine1911/1915/1917 synthase
VSPPLPTSLPPAIEPDDDPEAAGETSAGAAAGFEQRSTLIDATGHGARLDHVLVQLAPEFSRSHLQRLLEAGHVRLTRRGQPAPGRLMPARRMQAGESVQLELVPTDESRAFVPQAMALAIVHEDEALMVIDKPAGLVVHPAPGHWSGTLLNGLLAHHAAAAALPRAGIVHRLDRDTSGLMVVAKTPPAHAALVRAIAERSVQRRYLALAQGSPREDRFSCEAPIGRDPRSRIRMAVVGLAAGGRAARTDFEVLARRDGVVALHCKLHTGRTHQIRVHLAASAHPIVADALYGGAPGLGMQRQALHAWRLAFVHPLSGAALDFRAAPPRDFADAWAQVAGATMPIN